LRLERLGQEAVAADPGRALLVERLERAGEQQHGDVAEGRVLLDEVAHLVAVLLRHDDVAEDHVGADFLGLLDGEPPVADGCHLEVLVGEGQLDDLLDRDAVVRQQDLLAHAVTSRKR
jgi:hypothetical protein